MPAFDGEPLFPFLGHWGDDRRVSFSKQLTGLESDSGIASVTPLQRASAWGSVVSELLWTRKALVAAGMFLAGVRGRVTRFWMPSLKRDFILNGDQGAGYYVHCVASQFNGTMDELNLEHAAVLILDWSTMRWHARQLVAATAEGGGEKLQVYGPLPALSAGSVIQLMTLARLGTEDMELDMESTETARVQFHVESVPEEAVERVITSGGSDGDILDDDGLLQPDA